MGFRPFNWRIGLGLAVILVPFTSIAAKEPTVIVRFDPDKPNHKSAVVWLGYLISRTAFHEKHRLPIPESGEILPTFAEEVDARRSAVQIYRELKEKDRKLKDPYWETLADVERRGFMAAYVWTFLCRKEWPSKAQPFNNWKQHALPKHVAQTYGWLEGGRP
jgi:hypothetical protein